MDNKYTLETWGIDKNLNHHQYQTHFAAVYITTRLYEQDMQIELSKQFDEIRSLFIEFLDGECMLTQPNFDIALEHIQTVKFSLSEDHDQPCNKIGNIFFPMQRLYDSKFSQQYFQEVTIHEFWHYFVNVGHGASLGKFLDKQLRITLDDEEFKKLPNIKKDSLRENYQNYRTLIIEGLVDYLTQLYLISKSEQFTGAPDYATGRKFWNGILRDVPIEEIINDLMNENIESGFSKKLTARLEFNPFILEIQDGRLVVLEKINTLLDKL